MQRRRNRRKTRKDQRRVEGGGGGDCNSEQKKEKNIPKIPEVEHLEISRGSENRRAEKARQGRR
jgi:hypothetical protein